MTLRRMTMVGLPALLAWVVTPCAVADLKLKGNVAVEVDSWNPDNTTVDVTTELKLRTPRFHGLRAVVEAKAAAVEKEIAPKDIYLDFRASKALDLTLGYSKKILGVEYELSRMDRLTVHRSAIYQKMEALGLVGRQINLAARFRTGKSRDALTLGAALGGDASLNTNIRLSVWKQTGLFSSAAFALVEAHRVNGGFIPVFAETVAGWWEDGGGRIALELFHGVDAGSTEYRKLLGTPSTVQFAGAKVETALRFFLSAHAAMTPVFQASFVFDDLQDTGRNSLSFLGGLRFAWRRLAVDFNVQTRGVADPVQAGRRTFRPPGFHGQIIYTF